MIVKECRSCHTWFPSQLLSYVNYCPKPECQRMYRALIAGIKADRSVCADIFDVWDDQYPLVNHYDPYERVCRVCGDRLVKKNGTYSGHLRHCAKHRGQSPVPQMASWGVCAGMFLRDIWASQQPQLNQCVKERYGLETARGYLYCQKCGELSRTEDSYGCNWSQGQDYYEEKKKYFTLPLINVHHLKPVHTLTIDELPLIWDFTNLIAVCRKCHGEYHRKKEITVPTQKWKTMEKWLE